MRRLVLLIAGLSAAAASPAAAITIDPGAYTGRYYVVGFTGNVRGVTTVDLAAGTYALDNGTGDARSSFQFSVDAAGNVSVDSPSASASGSTLTLQNSVVTINAQTYAGRYFLSSFFPAQSSGNQSPVLVPGLTYTIDDGAEVGGSAFLFAVDASGAVSTTSPAAAASGSTLTFNTVQIAVNPQAYSAPYLLSSFYPTQFTGPQTFTVLPGLTYTLDDSAEIDGSAFGFAVDGSGGVSTDSPSASGAGGVLTLANVTAHIDSGCTGTYSITGYPPQQGSADVILIPALAVVVITPNGAQVFTPSAQFVVSIGCVAISAGNPYSASIQPPIKADGSSVFRSNRGVVPVKFTLTKNGVATCTLPPATISLVRTTGAGQGVVNQNDYIQPSDSGTAFRIDQAACQYVYNLGASSLGPGQYVVQISINGLLAGSAPFGIQ